MLLTTPLDALGQQCQSPPNNPVEYFEHWLDNNGAPFWPFWDSTRGWWEIRGLPNVMLLHFADLKRDLQGQIQKIATYLDIDVDEETMAKILQHCSFDYMKSNATNAVPLGGAFWEGGAKTFIHKGTNGRWADQLSKATNQKYLARAQEELGH